MKNQILKKPVARTGCSKRKMKKYKRTREMIREKFYSRNLGIPWDELGEAGKKGAAAGGKLADEIIIKKTSAVGMTEL